MSISLIGRAVAVAAILYFALARAVFETLGRETFLGIPVSVVHYGALVLAIVCGTALAAYVARRSGRRWWLRTAGASASAAALGALAHTVTLGFQVRWGERCSQCDPVGFMLELTATAAVIGAVGSVPVGYLARR